MQRMTTPPPSRNTLKRVGSHSYYAHYNTPQKARLQGAVQSFEDMGVPYFKEDLFRAHSFSHTAGYRALSRWREARDKEERGEIDPEVAVELEAGEVEQAEMIASMKESRNDDAARRAHNSTRRVENRGRNRKITMEDCREMEKIIRDYGTEGRQLSWKALTHEAGIEASTKTIRNAMGCLKYRRCHACKKGWVSPDTAKDRLRFAKIMKERYPDKEDWLNVRSSDEIHFGYSQGFDSPFVMRKPGERTCPDCIQQDVPPDDKEEDKVHAWAAIGYGFKSPLVFYDSSNSNGKMTLDCYANNILEPIVKPWLTDPKQGEFVLEEDGDSGHGGGLNGWRDTLGNIIPGNPKKENVVQRWKRENNLNFYFNCHASPDLTPIENCWSGPKSYVNSHAHFDFDTTKSWALSGWEAVSMESINERMMSMPERLEDVIQLEGQMSGW